ncbi:MAG: hypothetical protein ACPH4I_05795, partial [Flavobacteriaceae bacterium]
TYEYDKTREYFSTHCHRINISISVESCILNSKTYHCISAQSPIGSSLLGKKVGNSIQFNNQMIRIEELI